MSPRALGYRADGRRLHPRGLWRDRRDRRCPRRRASAPREDRASRGRRGTAPEGADGAAADAADAAEAATAGRGAGVDYHCVNRVTRGGRSSCPRSAARFWVPPSHRAQSSSSPTISTPTGPSRARCVGTYPLRPAAPRGGLPGAVDREARRAPHLPLCLSRPILARSRACDHQNSVNCDLPQNWYDVATACRSMTSNVKNP